MTLNMAPSLRKAALTVHVSCSVGLLGAIAAFLALALAGLFGSETRTLRAAYLAMDLLARFVVVPLAGAALVSGLAQSLGTPWGLFRHYWIAAKLALTAFACAILLAKMRLIAEAARLAAETVLPVADLREAGMQLAVHAAGGLQVLLIPAILSVYKPRGLTSYGRRKLGEPATANLQAGRRVVQTKLDPGHGMVTIKLKRNQVLAGVGVIVLLHLVILHLVGMGHGLH